MAINFDDKMMDVSEGPSVILAQGIPGQTPFFSIGEVQSVAADAGASVEMSGSIENPVLNFKIPRGVSGADSINDNAGEGDTDFVWSANKTWSEFQKAIYSHGTLANNSDLNDITGTSFYGLSSGSTYTNKPPIVSGFLVTYNFQSGICAQIAFELDSSKVYARRLLSSTWSDWKPYNCDLALTYKGVLDDNTDFDDIKEFSLHGMASGRTYSNNPLPTGVSGWLECLYYGSDLGGIYVQNVREFTNQYSFSRYYINGWSAWFSNNAHDIKNVYYAFGDSTTYGQIGGGSGQSPYNYPKCIGNLLCMTVKNKAVGGQGLIKDWSTIHTNYIDNLDMSDAKLISVGWAYNDSGYYSSMNFGAYDDTGSTTFIGKYYTIMNEFQTKCPDAQVVLITGYGYPDGTVTPMTKPTLTEQFTHAYTFADGSKTIKQMYDTLEEMCHLHGWPCINQAKGTCFNEWNADHMIGDQIHPNNDGYKAYGNMIAGKMSALYGNLAF